MSIKSICKTQVATIQKSSSLKDVSELMQQQHVGSVIVTEGLNGKRIPCGIITDRDLALAMGSSVKPQELRVEQIMRSHPFSVKTNDGIFETCVKMREQGIKRLPVVHEDGSLCGVISADDILSLMGEEINNLAKIIETQTKNEKGILMPAEKQVHI